LSLKKLKNIISDEPKTLKLCQSKISPDEIPTLVKQKTMDILTEGDPAPFYCVEEIEDITEEANGVEFVPKFWSSYMKKMKTAPVGGSKDGHHDPWETSPDDFYTVGGKSEGNKILLKLYVPPMGFSSTNERFIKHIRSGMVHFSIVSWTKDEHEVDENGYVTKIRAVESMKGERNDAVQVGLGAMKQKVNKEIPGEQPEKIKHERKYIMAENEYAEMIKNLGNRITNGEVSKIEIATALGIPVIGENHKSAIKTLKEISEIVGEKPVEKIKIMKANEQKVLQQKFENSREKLMIDEFGQPGTEKLPNLKREAAELMISKIIVSDEELKQQVETAKKSPVVLSFAKQEADITSNTNDLTGIVIKTGDAGQRAPVNEEV